jgi:hypothetical protein
LGALLVGQAFGGDVKRSKEKRAFFLSDIFVSDSVSEFR